MNNFHNTLDIQCHWKIVQAKWQFINRTPHVLESWMEHFRCVLERVNAWLNLSARLNSPGDKSKPSSHSLKNHQEAACWTAEHCSNDHYKNIFVVSNIFKWMVHFKLMGRAKGEKKLPIYIYIHVLDLILTSFPTWFGQLVKWAICWLLCSPSRPQRKL